MTARTTTKNPAGYIDELGRFRPIRSPQYVGTPKRKATAKDKRKYSRAKAGDLGKRKQMFAMEDVFDREIRISAERKEKEDKARQRELAKIEREMLGSSDEYGKGRTLVQFVRANGGINEHENERGELQEFTFRQSRKHGLVAKGGGKSLDKMFQAAREAGYDVADINDLLNRMSIEIRKGRPTYQTHGYIDYRDNPSRPSRLAKAAISAFDTDYDLDLDLNDVRRLKQGEKRIRRTAKKQPAKRKNPIDPLTAVTTGLSGVVSALQIKKMLAEDTEKAMKRKTPTKRKTNGRTTAKRNPARSTAAKKTRPIYLMTLFGRGEDKKGNRLVRAVYMTDGTKAGFNKEFKTAAAAKGYATRNKIKLVENPVSTAKKETRKAAIFGCMHCGTSLGGITSVAVKKAASNGCPKCGGWDIDNVALRKFSEAHTSAKLRNLGLKQRAERRKSQQQRVENPAKVPRRRTYEMFQGRKATDFKALAVSRHAPKRLDQLGDLIEIKLMDGTIIKPNPKQFKLCAANGKLWIAGGKFARQDNNQPVRVLNPIAEIDHVVYGTHKPHHGDNAYTHYIHKLGEDSGHLPTLAVDRDGFPVIRGGRYTIEARGIVN